MRVALVSKPILKSALIFLINLDKLISSCIFQNLMAPISYAELKKLIDRKENYILIDVREKDELKHGMIPTAQHIRLSEFLNSLSLSPAELKKKHGFSKKDRLILYCRSGNRSEFAAKIAREKGFNALNFAGSVLEWAKHDPNVRKY
ncbi:MAG: hypothetical protein EPN86_04545 [Nanoarchaeota archaeon]|nr:MAG: hypothetical protein EPN86_04545 [Nanoarchaeota archaeon]